MVDSDQTEISSKIGAYIVFHSISTSDTSTSNLNLFRFYITKTCLYNFDPLKSHFYVVKLGFTGVYIIFLISAENINCGYSLRLNEAVLTSTHNLSLSRNVKSIRIF